MPYLFLKPSRGAVVGDGDPVVIPYGRNRTDWEVELAAVVGRTAKYVPATEAQDYIFGYTVSIDVSDRGGRPPGGNATRSDWFVGKGHDSFAPQGPWIVPKEFYGDPMQNLRQTLSVGGTVLQDAQAGDMIHSLWEIVEYASSIITLYPGDVINNGTSGGTAAGSAETRTGRPLSAARRGHRGQHRRHRHPAHAGGGRRYAARRSDRRAVAGDRHLPLARLRLRPTRHVGLGVC